MSKPQITREEVETFKKEFLEGINHYRSELDRLEKEYLHKIETLKKEGLQKAENEGHSQEMADAEKMIDEL